MRRMYPGVLALCSLAVCLFAQDRCGFRPDPQYTLLAYELTPEQESIFQARDNQVTAFWYAWPFLQDANNKATLNCDDNYAYGPDNCKGRPEDAEITLKAAYGAQGVYLYFTVRDDHWEPVAPGQEHYFHFYDVVELFVEQKSAQELYNNPATSFMNRTFSQLGYTTNQFQIPFGGTTERTSSFDWVMPWGPMDEWRSGPVEWMHRKRMTFDEAEAQYRIFVDIVNSVAGTRKQEWFIPWERWGATVEFGSDLVNPGLGAKPQPNTRLGMTFGYNDMDPAMAGEDPSHSALRWRNRKDPWVSEAGDCPEAGQSVDAWGDILFGGTLDAALAAAGKPALTTSNLSEYYNSNTVPNAEDPDGTYNIDPSKSVSIRFNRRPAQAARSLSAARTEFYSITGRKITGANAARNGLVLRRDIDAAGKSVTSKLIAR